MHVDVRGATHTDVRDVYLIASTNTDIPTYYSPWLRERIRLGEVELPAYGDPNTAIRVSLRAQDVKGWVFYSKNYGPFIRRCAEWIDRPAIFFFTLGDSEVFQPRLPPLAVLLEQAAALVERFGAQAVIWKLPPLMFNSAGELIYAERLPAIAAAMRDLGVTSCMAEIYSSGFHPREMKRRLRACGADDVFEGESNAMWRSLAHVLAELRDNFGLAPLANDALLFPDFRVDDIENRVGAVDIGRMGMPCPTKCLYCDTNFTVNYDVRGERRETIDMDPEGHSLGLERYFASLGLKVSPAPRMADGRISPYAVELRAQVALRGDPKDRDGRSERSLLVNLIGDAGDLRRAYVSNVHIEPQPSA